MGVRADKNRPIVAIRATIHNARSCTPQLGLRAHADLMAGQVISEPMRSWSLRRGRTGYGWDSSVMERCLTGKLEQHVECKPDFVALYEHIIQTNEIVCGQFACQINHYVRH